MKSLVLKLSLCLLVVLLWGCGEAIDPAEAVRVGNHAPEFSLQSVDGMTVKSSSFKGNIVVLNFWATYCQPCRTEIPDLNKVASSARVKVIGIALDEGGTKAIADFEKDAKLKFDYPVLLGDEEVFKRFNGVGIPYTLVLDRAQRIVKIYRGPVDKEELEKDLAAIDRST